MTLRLFSVLYAAVAAVSPAIAQHDHDSEDAKDMEHFRVLLEQEAEELSVKNPQDSDIIALVERVMMVRLAQTLNLTVEETQNLGTRVGDCRSKVYNLKWLRADMRQSLRESIAGEDDIAVEQKLEKLLKLDITIAQLIEQMIDEAKNDLTTEQAAKFYLFIEDFEHELSRMIDKARELAQAKAVKAPGTAEHSATGDAAKQ